MAAGENARNSHIRDSGNDRAVCGRNPESGFRAHSETHTWIPDSIAMKLAMAPE